MNIYRDVLGNLVFDYGWVKSITMQFAKQQMIIPCVFTASKNETVSDEQVNAYTLFQQKQSHFEDRIEILLKQYISKNEIELPKCVPTQILFQRDGSFGILLDCNWDKEHGVVVVLSPTEMVGMQDIFL